MLNIELTRGQITNLTPRIETHGEESSQSVDITIACEVAGHSKGILTALRVGNLFDPLWDDEGRPRCQDADIRLKQRIRNCEVTLSDITGQFVTVLAHADMKGLRIQPLPDVALELRFKIHADIDGDVFGKLWNLQMDSQIRVSIEERQGSLDIAA